MNSIYNFAFLADLPTLVSQMGWAARLIMLTFVGMACWVLATGVTMRMVASDSFKAHRRLRYLGAVGQTAPLIGLLGTAIGMINALKGVAYQKELSWPQFSGGMAEALVTTAIGLLLGVAAHWTAALLESRQVPVHHK